VAAVAVAPVESAIAGKRLTLIEQAKGCHAFMAPFFYSKTHSALRMRWGSVAL
jgi:hypothetical protein